MSRPILLGAAILLAVPALAQTPSPGTGAPAATPPSDNRAAILDDAATTQRAGETDVGATRAPDPHPVGVGGSAGASRSYPPCTRARTDSCTQRRGRR